MNVILTTYQGAILGPIARVLGYILQALYALLANFGIENTGICMILFTFLVNGLMMPMQIKQQKFSKMSMIMNPEIQAIQKKFGLTQDGIIGPDTINALIAWGMKHGSGATKQDGKLDWKSATIKTMQRKLNDGTFFK